MQLKINAKRLLGEVHDRLRKVYRRRKGDEVKVRKVSGTVPASEGCPDGHTKLYQPYGYALCLVEALITDLSVDMADAQAAEKARIVYYQIHMAYLNQTRRDTALHLVRQRFVQNERNAYLAHFRTSGKYKGQRLNNTEKAIVAIQNGCANFEPAIFDERQQSRAMNKLQLELVLGNLTDGRQDERRNTSKQPCVLSSMDEPLEEADATAGSTGQLRVAKTRRAAVTPEEDATSFAE